MSGTSVGVEGSKTLAVLNEEFIANKIRSMGTAVSETEFSRIVAGLSRSSFSLKDLIIAGR